MNVPEPKKLKSGTWFIQLRLGGQSIPVSGLTATECRRKALLIKAERGVNRTPVVDMTLREACERYIERAEKAGRSPETIRGYSVIMNNRFASAMNTPVRKIKNWQRVYDEDAARLSPKTMANSWGFLKAVLKSAGFPLPTVATVDIPPSEHAFLDPEQIKVFVRACVHHKDEIPMLLYLSSCRASEVRGLDWKNVDLENNRILISGAEVRDKNNKPVMRTQNKTRESTRYIPIFIPELKTALEAVGDKTGYVARPATNTIRRHINALCRENNLPEVGVHGLRHSFASLCYSLGVPEKVAMQIGGWSDYRTMLGIYTHLSKRDVNKHTGALTAFFKNANGEKNANGVLIGDPQRLDI